MKALNVALLITAAGGLVDYLCTRLIVDRLARLLGRLLAHL